MRNRKQLKWGIVIITLSVATIFSSVFLAHVIDPLLIAPATFSRILGTCFVYAADGYRLRRAATER